MNSNKLKTWCNSDRSYIEGCNLFYEYTGLQATYQSLLFLKNDQKLYNLITDLIIEIDENVVVVDNEKKVIINDSKSELLPMTDLQKRLWKDIGNAHSQLKIITDKVERHKIAKFIVNSIKSIRENKPIDSNIIKENKSDEIKQANVASNISKTKKKLEIAENALSKLSKERDIKKQKEFIEKLSNKLDYWISLKK